MTIFSNFKVLKWSHKFARYSICSLQMITMIGLRISASIFACASLDSSSIFKIGSKNLIFRWKSSGFRKNCFFFLEVKVFLKENCRFHDFRGLFEVFQLVFSKFLSQWSESESLESERILVLLKNFWFQLLSVDTRSAPRISASGLSTA